MTRAPAWHFKMLHHQSVSILRIFPTTFVTMVICLVTFLFPLDVVLSVWAIRYSREMKQNVWKSIEWVFRIIQIGSIERTQNIFHKSLKCTSQFWVLKKCKKCQRCKQRDSFGAKFYLFDGSVHEKPHKRYLACEQSYCLLSAVLSTPLP